MLLIAPPVGLRAQRMNGGAFPEVQHPVLDAAGVRRLSHLSAERVQLPHQMALARPADGRVARHIADRVEIDRKYDRSQSHPRAGQPCLDPGVSGPDHRRIIASRFKSHTCSLGFLK